MSDISKLTKELADSSETERRREVAGELRDIGFARRQNLEKRGSIEEPADSDLKTEELELLHSALADDDQAVRHTTIVAVGDLGDASSVSPLLEHLESQDQSIRLAAIASLGDIGGTKVVVALSGLACDDSELADVRLAALTELEELAAKQITSGPDRRFDPPSDPHAAKQALEDSEQTSTATEELAKAAKAIESESAADPLLRLKAADVHSYLAGELGI